MKNLFKISTWDSAILKLICLSIIAIPLLTGWPLKDLQNIIAQSTKNSVEISFIISFSLYCFILWGFLLINLGLNKLLSYFSASFTIALTTCLSGAILRKLFPVLAGGKTDLEIGVQMTFLYLNIATVIPFSIFAINCFSARKIIQAFSRKKGTLKTVSLHLALTLRVFQHTGEVVFNLLDIWKELYPGLLMPDNEEFPRNRFVNPYKYILWFLSAIQAWIFACIMHTFEPLPAMVQELENINQQLGDDYDKES